MEKTTPQVLRGEMKKDKEEMQDWTNCVSLRIKKRNNDKIFPTIMTSTKMVGSVSLYKTQHLAGLRICLVYLLQRGIRYPPRSVLGMTLKCLKW